MTMIYRISDWDATFESAKSRSIAHCSKAVFPNHTDGFGMSKLMMLDDGPAIYGLFHMMVALCSRQDLPRQGWLTQDGTETGEPLSIDDLALMFRRKPKEVQRAIDVLSASPISWLQAQGYREDTARILQGPEVSSKCPPSIPPLTHSLITLTHSSSRPCAASSDSGLAAEVLVFECSGKEPTWELHQAQIDDWRKLYSGLDVLAECKKAWAWHKAKSGNKKTARGMPAFLVNWLNRATNSGGNSNARPASPALVRNPGHQAEYAALESRAIASDPKLRNLVGPPPGYDVPGAGNSPPI